MIGDSLYQSNKQDWSTPRWLFDLLNNEFNFDLDVCADNENKKVDRFYSIEDSAFEHHWVGTCWMNPPYGRGISEWMAKAWRSALVPPTKVVCLLPVRSDTKWWHNYAMESSEIRFLNKRLSFGGSSNKAPFPSAIIVFSGRSSPVISSFLCP